MAPASVASQCNVSALPLRGEVRLITLSSLSWLWLLEHGRSGAALFTIAKRGNQHKCPVAPEGGQMLTKSIVYISPGRAKTYQRLSEPIKLRV